MKNIWYVLQRNITNIISVGMFSTVYFKLFQNDSNWITKALLCWVSFIIALIFRVIEVEKQKKSNFKSKIIDINIRKSNNKDNSLLTKILDILEISITIYFTYAFILGIILGLKNWNELTWYMLLYFITSYIICL